MREGSVCVYGEEGQLVSECPARVTPPRRGVVTSSSQTCPLVVEETPL